MHELWNAFMDDRTFAIRLIRALAMGVALYMGVEPETAQQWLVVVLGGGALSLGAGEKNA